MRLIMNIRGKFMELEICLWAPWNLLMRKSIMQGVTNSLGNFRWVGLVFDGESFLKAVETLKRGESSLILIKKFENSMF